MVTRIGLVGHGKMGRIHRKAIEATPGCSLDWIVDPDGSGTHTTPGTGLKADLVIVASPTPTHAAMAVLFGQNCPVLVEKPICESVESANFLCKLPVCVSQPLRYSVKKPRGKPSWFVRFVGQRLTGTHPLYDLAVHDVDLARFWGMNLDPLLETEITPETYEFSLGHCQFSGGYAEDPDRGIVTEDGTFHVEQKSTTAISDQLVDMLTYVRTGHIPSRLCTARQAREVLLLLKAVDVARCPVVASSLPE